MQPCEGYVTYTFFRGSDIQISVDVATMVSEPMHFALTFGSYRMVIWCKSSVATNDLTSKYFFYPSLQNSTALLTSLEERTLMLLVTNL